MSSDDRTFVFRLIDELNNYEIGKKASDAAKASAGGQHK